jgi:hypothetical protein
LCDTADVRIYDLHSLSAESFAKLERSTFQDTAEVMGRPLL